MRRGPGAAHAGQHVIEAVERIGGQSRHAALLAPLAHMALDAGDQARLFRAAEPGQLVDQQRPREGRGVGDHGGAVAGDDRRIAEREQGEIGIVRACLELEHEVRRRNRRLEDRFQAGGRARAGGDEQRAAGARGEGLQVAREIAGDGVVERHVLGRAAEQDGDARRRQPLELRAPARDRLGHRAVIGLDQRQGQLAHVRRRRQPVLRRGDDEVVGLELGARPAEPDVDDAAGLAARSSARPARSDSRCR